MTVAIGAYRAVVPGYTPPPMATVQFRLLREGEVTDGEKHLRLFYGRETLSRLALVFWAEPGEGEYTQSSRINLATLQANDWLALGTDNALPPKVRMVYLSLTESGVYTFNITSGEGGGGPSGTPAMIESILRVDGQPANREVVVIERPSDGQWRIAGYGPTLDGEVELELKVTDGSCYALALDDFGVEFAASLDVIAGQRIRPTQYQGWLYEITEPGQLPVAEPQWWAAQGDNATRTLGTARALAVRYYRPLAHGPIPVEII